MDHSSNGSSVSKSNADLNSFVLIKPRLAIPWTNMLCFKNLQMLWILVEGNNVSSVNKERKLLNLFERKAYGILFIIFRSLFFLRSTEWPLAGRDYCFSLLGLKLAIKGPHAYVCICQVNCTAAVEKLKKWNIYRKILTMQSMLIRSPNCKSRFRFL